MVWPNLVLATDGLAKLGFVWRSCLGPLLVARFELFGSLLSHTWAPNTSSSPDRLHLRQWVMNTSTGFDHCRLRGESKHSAPQQGLNTPVPLSPGGSVGLDSGSFSTPAHCPVLC